MTDPLVNVFKGELAILILCFGKIVSPYHKISSNAIKFEECKELVESTKAKLNKCIHASWDKRFETLLNLDGPDSKRLDQALPFICQANETYQRNLSRKDKKNYNEYNRLDSVVHISCEEMLEKLKWVLSLTLFS